LRTSIARSALAIALRIVSSTISMKRFAQRPTTPGDHVNPSPGHTARSQPWEEREVDDVAAEASRIGGYAGDECLAPAQRPLLEAGEGVAEGFELAEDLIAAAETGEGWNPETQAFPAEPETGSGEYAEADHEGSSELPYDDRSIGGTLG
jgi:hypothetical protein